MKLWLSIQKKLQGPPSDQEEYRAIIHALFEHPMVQSMEAYIQHSNISCLEHCLFVSYVSFWICKRLGFDYIAAARAGLLHDFFLYDWHMKGERKGLHGFTHPHASLQNALRFFAINEIERDIIIKHMWPLTLSLPRYRETWVVLLVDKYCATLEFFRLNNKETMLRLIERLGLIR